MSTTQATPAAGLDRDHPMAVLVRSVARDLDDNHQAATELLDRYTVDGNAVHLEDAEGLLLEAAGKVQALREFV